MKTMWDGSEASEYLPCRHCHGLSKTPCYACKQSVKKVKDMTLIEVIRYEAHKGMISYLLRLFKTYKSLNTHPDKVEIETRRKIVLHIGVWWS